MANKNKVTDDAFDMYQPFVTNEQKFKYWEESKAEIKRLNAASQHYEREIERLELSVQNWKDFCKKVQKIDFNDYLALENKIAQLTAQVNQLREKLENALTSLEESQEKECRCYYTR